MQSKHSNESQATADQHEDVNDQLAHDASFFDKPKNVKIILNVFYAICVVLVILDFVIHRHIYLSFEEIPAFYAIYGFVACVVLVVLAKLMRLVLMRDEHYYDERLDETEQVENTDTPGNSDEKMRELVSSSHSISGDKK